jgi:hypothetical protein
MEFGDLISVLRKIRTQRKTIVQEEKSLTDGGGEEFPLSQPLITKVSTGNTFVLFVVNISVIEFASDAHKRPVRAWSFRRILYQDFLYLY